MRKKRVVVIDVVGLSPEHFKRKEGMPNMASLLGEGRLFRMKPVFPCVTLPVQASLTSGAYPETHGVVSNGFYFPESFQISFWEQASALVQAERIWDRLKKKDRNIKTAALFFQNTLYADLDAVITPRPMHTDEGLIQWCYSKPVGLYEEVCGQIGDFELLHYWGPLASIESSRWIAGAALEVFARIEPDLMFVYLPHLDYCSQKYSPADARLEEELGALDREIGRIVQGIKGMKMGDETLFIVLSEYVFSGVKGDIPLNHQLREKGLLHVRTIKGREYLDIELSQAFAMVDHQVAHVYIKAGQEKAVHKVLEGISGIDFLLDAQEKKKYRVDHPRSGEIIAVSARDRWFSYPWWDDRPQAPDFATHVDIHRKPGYDPLELFLEQGTFEISQDTGLIRGSHGYPPLSEADQTVFLISGESSEKADVPDDLCVTDVPGIIEGLLLS